MSGDFASVKRVEPFPEILAAIVMAPLYLPPPFYDWVNFCNLDSRSLLEFGHGSHVKASLEYIYAGGLLRLGTVHIQRLALFN